MEFPNDVERRGPSRVPIAMALDQAGSRTGFGHQPSAIAHSLISLFAAITMLVVFLFWLQPVPALSQGVELVKVDLAVVAKGYHASKLMGSSVTYDKNENIGKIDDLIIDHKNVLFAVLQVGGFLGLGAHLVAVPYDSLFLDEAGQKIQLPGASKERLKGLSEFKYQT
jgi:hypothetical protein